MPTIKVQAREIFRAAKRHGVCMTVDRGYKNCAIGMTLAAAGQPLKDSEAVYELIRQGIYSYTASVVGLSVNDVLALEGGYENQTDERENRYYKVGKNLRKLVTAHRAKINA